MSDLANTATKKRPEFRNINAFKDLPHYRWPLASLVSGMHRASGAIMFLLMPFIIWMFDTSVSSEFSFARFTSAFTLGLWFVPGWMMKLVALALIWAYTHHFIAGLRNVWMESTHISSKEAGRKSALLTLVLAFSLTAVLGAKLFGAY